MGSKRRIIHLNITGFSHAVAALVDPSLQNRPVVVAAEVNRSQILDVSPHAFSFGIRKGMAVSQAMRLCPDCQIIPPRINLYNKAMTALCREVLPFSPFIEPGYADGHIFADISGTSKLFGPGIDVARRICKSTTRKIGLHPTWAIGPNKLVAKVANRVSRQQGECEVAPGTETLFLAPHQLNALPGIKMQELHFLDDFCINTMGDTACLSLEQLQVLLGKRACFYHDSCRGIDNLPVGQSRHSHAITSIFNFPEDTNNQQHIREVLCYLGSDFSFKLRREQRSINIFSLGVLYADASSSKRQVKLSTPSNNDTVLISSAQDSLHLVLRKRIRIRVLSLRANQFCPAGMQLSLFNQQRQETIQNQKLMAALDTISTQFGSEKMRRGRAVPLQYGPNNHHVPYL
jgi:DNA polymerase-4